MAKIQCELYSNSLMSNTTVTLIIPTYNQNPEKPFGSIYEAGKKFKTLYLLHGMYGDHSEWTRNTMIEVYAEQNDLAVVMPSGANSFYTDMKHGERYFTWVADELPVAARALFSLSEKREDNFIAGLSMGGYGALKLALSRPEQYSAAISLSGAVDIINLFKDREGEEKRMIEEIFGPIDQLKGSEHDVIALARKLKDEGGDIPRLYQACGTEDFLYPLNIGFRETIRAMGIELTFEEGPGIHDFYFWNTYIKKAIEWLGLKS